VQATGLVMANPEPCPEGTFSHRLKTHPPTLPLAVLDLFAGPGGLGEGFASVGWLRPPRRPPPAQPPLGSAHQHEPPPNPQRWAQPTLRPYSIIGRSRVGGIDPKDPRVQLYREYLRILAVHRPAVFVMENVRGILSARLEDRSVFTQILQDLQEPTAAIRTSTGKRRIRAGDAAYRVWSLVKKPGNSLIDASPLFEPGDFLIQCEDYGIPQARHRVIILGIREDLSKSPRTLTAHERSISLRVGCVKALRRRTIPPVDASSRSRCVGAKP